MVVFLVFVLLVFGYYDVAVVVAVVVAAVVAVALVIVGSVNSRG